MSEVIPAQAVEAIAKVEASWDENGASTCGYEGVNMAVIPAEAIEAAAAAIQVRTDQPLELEDLARAALEAAAPHMLIHIHHHDIEAHARSFNEGYAAAMAQMEGEE